MPKIPNRVGIINLFKHYEKTINFPKQIIPAWDGSCFIRYVMRIPTYLCD